MTIIVAACPTPAAQTQIPILNVLAITGLILIAAYIVFVTARYAMTGKTGFGLRMKRGAIIDATCEEPYIWHVYGKNVPHEITFDTAKVSGYAKSDTGVWHANVNGKKLPLTFYCPDDGPAFYVVNLDNYKHDGHYWKGDDLISKLRGNEPAEPDLTFEFEEHEQRKLEEHKKYLK